MSGPVPFSLRVLICDPEKASRQRLHDCLAINPWVEASTPVAGADPVLDLLNTKQINLLFIDPIALTLSPASQLIFHIREHFPHVVICLYVRGSEVRRQAVEFYFEERERFEHYYRLDKELPGTWFGEETFQMVSQCLEAARNLSHRPVRICLTTRPPAAEAASRPGRSFNAEPPPARELNPTPANKARPARSFMSYLPGLGSGSGHDRISS